MNDIDKEIQERIASDPAILSGKPVVRGTRISIDIIIDRLSNGISETEIVEDYPSLSPEDVRAALAFYLRQVTASSAVA